MFHYRNHGADVGRVLVGVQVPAGGEANWATFLETLSFVYHEETGNPLARTFF